MKNKAKGCLRLISLGKYPTVFYSKEEGYSFKSSVIGGIITLLIILASGGFIVDQAVSMF
jgi:hypothetical protein